MKIDVPAGILAWFDFEFPDVGQNAAQKLINWSQSKQSLYKFIKKIFDTREATDDNSNVQCEKKWISAWIIRVMI